MSSTCRLASKAGPRVISELFNNAKRTELQNLAALTGNPVSATKTQLISCLEQDYERTQDAYSAQSERGGLRDLRILSIDMGIRNLAFALLTSRVQQQSRSKEVQKPVVELWRRIAVSATSTGRLETTPVNGEHHNSVDRGTSPMAVKESFEPNVMATYALEYARYFAALRPTHILIERQRFRSGGGSAVQEWTIRVGMFESMLYAIFEALQGRDGFHAVMQPILPARVNKFWLETEGVLPPTCDMTQKSSKLSSVRAKLLKIELVRRMIQHDQTDGRDALVSFGGQTQTMCKLYSAGSNGRSSRGGGKLDDLSDSLLQGLAWLRWLDYKLRHVT